MRCPSSMRVAIAALGMLPVCTSFAESLSDAWQMGLSRNMEFAAVSAETQSAQAEGLVVIDAQRLRSLEQNRADALERLRTMIEQALVEPKPRRKTRPTLASKKRRLEGKTQRGKVKALRRKSFDD